MYSRLRSGLPTERGGLPPTLEAMSNLLWTSIQLSTAKRIAGKWIHLFKCTSPRGRRQGRSIGGSENAGKGSAVYEVWMKTTVDQSC
jgi:hypothetical protein